MTRLHDNVGQKCWVNLTIKKRRGGLYKKWEIGGSLTESIGKTRHFGPISLVLFGPKTFKWSQLKCKNIWDSFSNSIIGYLWAFKEAFQIKTFAICKWTFLLNNWRIMLLYGRGFWTWWCLLNLGFKTLPFMGYSTYLLYHIFTS